MHDVTQLFYISAVFIRCIQHSIAECNHDENGTYSNLNALDVNKTECNYIHNKYLHKRVFIHILISVDNCISICAISLYHGISKNNNNVHNLINIDIIKVDFTNYLELTIDSVFVNSTLVYFKDSLIS